ncbi:uncharacterized protein BDV17DRAFT_280247 [Aspergillus undulatus]|uniref:uncharacterized protein n=1 Tax=Aspergillus undulatus TaxID=1810928 RepID=UPI003CCCF0F2
MDNSPALARARKNLIIILGTNVLRLNSWVNRHPGGDIVIKHMVGRDTTDEVNALHSAKALRAMRAYQIGSVEDRWVNFVLPIQGGRFRSYDSNDEDVEDVGSDTSSKLSSSPPFTIFDTVEGEHELRRCHLMSTISSSSSLAPGPESSKPQFRVLDARTQQEIALDKAQYPPLDAEHQHTITLKYRALDKQIQKEGLYNCNYSAYAVEFLRYSILFTLFLFSLQNSHFVLAGLFLGCFWHQLVFTAHDAGHMGITHDFNTDTIIGIIVADFIGGLSLGWWKCSHNVHYIMTNSPENDPDIELMPFFAVSYCFFTNLHTLNPRNKNQGPLWPRYLEFTGQIFFWTWFGYGICYLTDLGVTESFPQKMLRTTMDMIHYLYPRIPRDNLRQAQRLVREFCQDARILYAVFTFVDGNRKVLGRLGDIARQARIFEEGRREAAGMIAK